MRVIEGQSLVDLCIREHGTIEALFEFSNLNNLSITGEIIAGQELKVSKQFTVTASFTAKPLRPARRVPIIVTEGQSLIDLAIQECGTVEALFEFTDQNALSVTDEIAPGMQLVNNPATVSEATMLIVNYFKGSSTRINTGITNKSDSTVPDTKEGIGYWIIGETFRVS